LKKPIELFVTLKDGFWSFIQVETTEDKLANDNEVCDEFSKDDTFMGNLCNCPLPSFHVAHDLYERYFVAIRLANDDSKPIWIAKALSNPFTNSKYPNCMLIQHFWPYLYSIMFKSSFMGGTLSKDYIGKWTRPKIQFEKTPIVL